MTVILGLQEHIMNILSQAEERPDLRIAALVAKLADRSNDSAHAIRIDAMLHVGRELNRIAASKKQAHTCEA